jgi:hypothetical protein
MPTKSTTGAVCVAAIETALPRGFFVTRGDVQRAFGFTKDEIRVLVESGIFVAEYPAGRTRHIGTRAV